MNPSASGIILAVPSKGRLKEETARFFARSGLEFRQAGGGRDYSAAVPTLPGVEVQFLSAAEIVDQVASGRAHFGVTGEDLVREHIADAATRVELVRKLGFGHADVVVAVPDFWLDVTTMADLEEMSPGFQRCHGRWLRVATKYVNITRSFFEAHGLNGYRIVESLGATEGTPAAGTADLIVDITSTGETLRANGLRILDDGVILRSEANLVVSHAATWTDETRALAAELRKRLGC